jgi:transposase
MPRHGLTDEQWQRIEHLFPKPAWTGRPRTDFRKTFDGILWILRTGAPWRDLPAEFGPCKTVFHHFNQWRKDGLLATIVAELQVELGLQDCLDHELWCIDGTNVRAARCAAGGGKKGIPRNPKITL